MIIHTELKQLLLQIFIEWIYLVQIINSTSITQEIKLLKSKAKNTDHIPPKFTPALIFDNQN